MAVWYILICIYGIHWDFMPKICPCFMPKWHMFDKTLSEENQREWHREGKAIFMKSLFEYLIYQRLFESYLGNNFVSDGHVCNIFCSVLLKLVHMRHWQLIWSKLRFYFMSDITLDIVVVFLWRTSYWSIKVPTWLKQVAEVQLQPFLTIKSK